MATYSEQSQPSPPQPAGGALSGGTALIAVVVGVLAVPLMVLAALVGGILPGVSWWLGIPLGLAAAGLIVAARLRNSADARLRELGAVPADTDEHARFHNVVQGLSLAGGIPEPELHVVEDEARNVACVAAGDRSAIVATTGLLGAVDRIALEGLMAVAVVRIRNGDAAAATLAAALFGRFRGGTVGRALEPLVELGMRRHLSADRDLAADRAAVRITRYPPGLLAALTTVRSGAARPAASDAANDHLWLVPPSAVDQQAPGVVGPAPLDLRIDVLAEL